MGISSIESVLYGIRWAHSLVWIVECQTSHPLVQSSLEGARRKLARSVQPKEPFYLSTQFVGSLIIMYLLVISLLFIFFSFSWLASLGFTVWVKLVVSLLKMSLFAENTCQFSFQNVRWSV